MSKTFTRSFNGDPKELIDKASAMASEHSVNFTGDETAGNFAGQGISGSYQVSGQQLQITIMEKPFFLPWEMVESGLNQYFPSA